MIDVQHWLINWHVFVVRVGIIGDPMSGFNPLTLAPFGEEEHDETDINEDRTKWVATLILFYCLYCAKYVKLLVTACFSSFAATSTY